VPGGERSSSRGTAWAALPFRTGWHSAGQQCACAVTLSISAGIAQTVIRGASSRSAAVDTVNPAAAVRRRSYPHRAWGGRPLLDEHPACAVQEAQVRE
jgi:hypothetical protein